MSPFLILAIIAVLHILDVITTKRALDRGGVELNPIARALFGVLGTLPASIAMKLVGSIPMVALLLLYPAYWLAGLIYAFVLAAIVANNAFSLAD